jgi:hypothetical protein
MTTKKGCDCPACICRRNNMNKLEAGAGISMKYRKKPVVIEALVFNGENYKECEAFIGKDNVDNTLSYPNIKTLEGVMRVSVGDYIIRGVQGECYPCKPDIFKATYDRVYNTDEG